MVSGGVPAVREASLARKDRHFAGKTKLTPVERKHGTPFFDNDEVQLAAYCMLLEDYLGEPVQMGYLFGTNERYAITITDWHHKHGCKQ
jgi:CRISPR/Cas system-associated exonuclease Cas4 (RecB family)